LKKRKTEQIRGKKLEKYEQNLRKMYKMVVGGAGRAQNWKKMYNI
jgi:hypothetical protein